MMKILAILVLIGLVMLPMVAIAGESPIPPAPPAASSGCDQVVPLLGEGVGDGTIPPAGTDAILNFGVCRSK